MLTTPSLKIPIRPFDAKEDYEFIFYIDGSGRQVLRNNLIIEEVETGVQVYNKTQESFAYKHTVLANTLTNGKHYKVKIRTGGATLAENKWSPFTEYELFYCLTPAVITVPTIDTTNQNRVYDQTVVFEATYSQLENDALQSYRFLLYNSNKDLIKSFPEKFGSSDVLQEIAGLENGELYYIQVKTESVKGLLSGTELLWFRPFYITPRLSAVITPENISEKGAIKLSSNIIQVIGKLYDQNNNEISPFDIEYIDSEWIDLTRPDYSRLEFKDGLEVMQSDFTMKFWCKNIPENIVFTTLHSPNGKIDLIKRENRIHAYKTIRGYKHLAHFASDEFDFVTNTQYVVSIRQVSNLIDVVVVPY